MFDGSSSSSRRGGRKKKEAASREEVVEKARRQREARAAARTQEHVAVMIQAVVRGWVVRRRWERELRESFGEKRLDVGKVQHLVENFVIPVASLQALVRELNGFAECLRDVKEVEFLADLALDVDANEMLKDACNLPEACLRWKRFLTLVAEVAFMVRKEGDGGPCASLLRKLALEETSEGTRWVVDVLLEDDADVVGQFVKFMCFDLPEEDTKPSVSRKALSSAQFDLISGILETDFNIGKKSSLKHVARLLSAPLLQFQIEEEILAGFLSSQVLQEGLKFGGAAKVGFRPPCKVPFALFQLGNLISLLGMDARSSKEASLTLDAILYKITQLFMEIPEKTFHDRLTVIWLDESSTAIALPSLLRQQLQGLTNLELCRFLALNCFHVLDDEALEDRKKANDRVWEVKAAALRNKALTEPSLKAASSKSAFQKIKSVLSTSSWAKLLGGSSTKPAPQAREVLQDRSEISRNLASHGMKPFKVSKGSKESSLFLANSLARMLSVLLWRWPLTATNQTTLGVLNSFAFGDPSICTHLWTLCESTVLPECSNHSFAEMETNAQSLLLVLCAIFHHRIMVTDDEELYEEGMPLHRAEIEQLILSLKTMLFKTISRSEEANSARKGSRHKDIVSALTHRTVGLLAALYERHSRNPLCETKIWLVPQLNYKDGVTSLTGASEQQKNRLIREMPFGIPYSERVKMFQKIIRADRTSHQPEGSRQHRFRVRRAAIFDDGFRELSKLGPRMKQKLYVVFVNDAGSEETGIDAGGLFKEFWTTLSAVAFNTEYGLFEATADQFLYPSPQSGKIHGEASHLALFEFLGMIVGKALYEEIVIQPQFARFFLSKLIGRYSSIGDLPSLDLELYKNLTFLKTYDGDVRDLCLTFSVIENDLGEQREVELIPGGSKVEVNSYNKFRYINLMADYYLNQRTRAQNGSFLKGFSNLIQPEWLRLFSEPEMQTLISGAFGSFSLQDLKRNTVYANGFHGMDRTVARFWRVVEELSDEDKAALLKFVTSCERPPLLGFSALQPPFCLHRVSVSSDDDRLPTASTCFNILKLPTYSSSKVMKTKLQYAIRSGAGFEMS